MKSEAAVTPEMLQANPGLAILLTLFSMLIIALLVGCVSTWLWAIFRWSSGKPLLALEPWRPRSWGLLDLVLVGFMVLAAQVIGFKIWADANGIDLRELKEEHTDSLSAMATGALTLLAVMLLATIWLLIRYSATFKHLGLSLRKLPQHSGLGLAAAAMWLPVVILIMASVSVGTGQEYDHPLINRLNEDGTLGSYLLAVFCAVVAAPLVEEFLFRVLLQGWLQSIPWTVSSLWWLLGANQQQSQVAVHGGSFAEPIVAEAMSSEPPRLLPAEQNPYAPSWLDSGVGTPSPLPPILPQASLIDEYSDQAIKSDAGQGALDAPAEPTPPVWPVFVAGTLFGLAHWDYGVSFVPLIVLGIVLGFLYRATQSIWPCFVLHFSLNAFSMAGLGLGLLMEAAK